MYLIDQLVNVAFVRFVPLLLFALLVMQFVTWCHSAQNIFRKERICLAWNILLYAVELKIE
jgi:hypothetical protein